MPDRPDKPPEMGNKRRAGNLISHYLRLVLQEEVINEDGTTMIKAEAVARLICDKAIGHKETLPDGEIVYHEPDKDYVKLLYDRVEGKVTNSEETKDRGQTLPEKVSEINKDKLNKGAEKTVR